MINSSQFRVFVCAHTLVTDKGAGYTAHTTWQSLRQAPLAAPYTTGCVHPAQSTPCTVYPEPGHQTGLVKQPIHGGGLKTRFGFHLFQGCSMVIDTVQVWWLCWPLRWPYALDGKLKSKNSTMNETANYYSPNCYAAWQSKNHSNCSEVVLKELAFSKYVLFNKAALSQQVKAVKTKSWILF